VLKLKTISFVEILKSEIFQQINATIEQTINGYLNQIDEHLDINRNENSSIKSGDRILHLKIQEFLHLLTKVLANIKTVLDRVQVIFVLFEKVILRYFYLDYLII
jgi:hypothetical protein